MKTPSEKEKKLNLSINKLQNINLENPSLKNSLKNIDQQKNQLEIEKKEVENKYYYLIHEYEQLKQKLEEINNKKKVNKKKK